VYGWDSLVLLQHLLDEGLSKTAIAQRLGVSRRVVHHWIATGQLTRDITTAPPRQYPPRRTQLDPFTAIIAARLATYPELSAVRLFEEVRAAGYPGGITQVREYVARVRPRPAPEPVVRFETPPGHQAQADFPSFGSRGASATRSSWSSATRDSCGSRSTRARRSRPSWKGSRPPSPTSAVCRARSSSIS
jgi:transposase